MESFIRGMPKVELHAHLNGSLSTSTLLRLIELKCTRDPSFRAPQASAVAVRSHHTLEEAFEVFGLIHQIVDTVEAVAVATEAVIRDFADEHVIYLELRSGPKTFAHSSKLDYLKAMNAGIERAENVGILVKLLVSFDRKRPISEAEENLAAALAARDELGIPVVGVELSGDPSVSNGVDFVPVLQNAKSHGFKISIHVAETADKPEEVGPLLSIRPDRLGHATFLAPKLGGRQDWVDQVLKHRIPIELCLTSNVKCQTVRDYDDHHYQFWALQDHPVVICTDDKGIFETTLSREYELISTHFGLSQNDILELSRRSLDSLFCNAEEKRLLQDKFESISN